MHLRWAGPEDTALLEEALLDTVAPEPGPPTMRTDGLRTDPTLARYLVDFSSPGHQGQQAPDPDGRIPHHRRPFGVVGELEGRPVGLAWTVFFTAEAPGPGFVSVEAPELRVWVRQEFRGRGFGRTLAESLILAARSRGLPGLSAWVDAFDPAIGLYFDLGFRTVGAGGHSETMLLTLR
ncbi:GNAT family N-acetyltransferase [Raineyella fluvialis]|uniref:GNAT family N-acetyltransferase n=1 Tax=Raineyella fluvialis TaxID=2662261 RepID=A0A5Q2FF02_9ACTN|nr:GNAT family N-acetyltransferase [Raineyella fluvialis]QGF24084.1 GNAT family N-acetyltransferase [Raineyella fluvialis]